MYLAGTLNSQNQAVDTITDETYSNKIESFIQENEKNGLWVMVMYKGANGKYRVVYKTN
jgi:hypothetical protein